MTLKKFGNHQAEKADVGVWFCEICEFFHLKAGNILLTFTKEEFGEFTDSVLDCRLANTALTDFSIIH